jgi:SAM-dependent methyltransferase
MGGYAAAQQRLMRLIASSRTQLLTPHEPSWTPSLAHGCNCPSARCMLTFPRALLRRAAMSTHRLDLLAGVSWPSTILQPSPEDLERMDASPDALFYAQPRLVTHIDAAALSALTAHYQATLPPPSPELALLDICSSWVSHFPPGHTKATCQRVAGLGMNAEELARNPVLSEHAVHDLNADPRLPYSSGSFDAVTCCASIDYLTRPVEVLREVHRVLRPGGTCILSFSNRCFPTKAVKLWLRSSDEEHVHWVGGLLHLAGFPVPQAFDLSPAPGRSDPLFVVSAARALV